VEDLQAAWATCSEPTRGHPEAPVTDELLVIGGPYEGLSNRGSFVSELLALQRS
jgi:hypothetical protein